MNCHAGQTDSGRAPSFYLLFCEIKHFIRNNSQKPLGINSLYFHTNSLGTAMDVDAITLRCEQILYREATPKGRDAGARLSRTETGSASDLLIFYERFCALVSPSIKHGC